MAIPLDPPRHTPLGRAERAGEGAEGAEGGRGRKRAEGQGRGRSVVGW